MSKSGLFKLIIIFATTLLILAVAFSIKYFFSTSSETAQVEVVANSTQTSTNKTNNLPINKPNSAQNTKVEKDLVLQKQADLLLNFFDKMPAVPVFVKDEPILQNGTNTERGLAYTTCENQNVPTIFIKKVFYQKKNQKQITNILKHELTHAYFCRQGVQVGHDERWRKKFESIGGFGN
jgi:SprT-like family